MRAGLADEAALAGGAAALGAAGGAYAMHRHDEGPLDRGDSHGQGYDSRGVGASMLTATRLSSADSGGLAGLDGQMGALQMRDDRDHYASPGGLDSYGGHQALGMADSLMREGGIDNFAGDRLGGHGYDDGLLLGERDGALLGAGGLDGQYGGGVDRELGGYLDRDLVGGRGYRDDYGQGHGVGGLGGEYGYDRGVGGSYGLDRGYDRGIGGSYGHSGFSEGYDRNLGGYDSYGGLGSHGHGYGPSSPYSYVGIDGGGYLPGARIHDQSMYYNPAVSTVRRPSIGRSDRSVRLRHRLRPRTSARRLRP